MTPQIVIRYPDTLIAEMQRRADPASGGISEATRRSLERYYALLAHARQQLRPTFSGGELSLLCDINNGTTFEPAMLPTGLLANAEDCEPEYYAKWGVDRAAFIAKLRKLDSLQEYALVDAIERFWTGVSTAHSLAQPDPTKILED